MNIVLTLLIAGAIGALVKEILEDNKLTLPKIRNGELCLGFLGSCGIGAIAGYLIDGNPLTAALAGYSGYSIVKSFIEKKNSQIETSEKTTEEIIRKIAKEEGVDPDLAVRVAKCESKLDWKAVNINKDGSRDRGIFQINEKYHQEVSDEQAFDPIFSTQFFCKAFKAGNLPWWNATKDCWQK